MEGTSASATLPRDGADSGVEGLSRDRRGSAVTRGRERHCDIMGESNVNPASWRVFSTSIKGLTTIVARPVSVNNETACSQMNIACQHFDYQHRPAARPGTSEGKLGPYDEERRVTRRVGKKPRAGGRGSRTRAPVDPGEHAPEPGRT